MLGLVRTHTKDTQCSISLTGCYDPDHTSLENRFEYRRVGCSRSHDTPGSPRYFNAPRMGMWKILQSTDGDTAAQNYTHIVAFHPFIF